MKRYRLTPGWKLPDDFWVVNEADQHETLAKMGLTLAIFVLVLLVALTALVVLRP